MARNWVLLTLLGFVVLLGGFSPASASPPSKIASAVLSNVVSALFKKLWSLKSTTKTALPSRSMLKFESGYTVETVFDGNKLGIEPFSLEVSSTGELLILDSENSNLYEISMPLSRFSRPKLIAGSPEGYSGHVDGRLREARMYKPKGVAVDGRGNIYIADSMNMAIRKISDSGVTTIAGGKWNQGSGHVDGPSEDAKFSNDFTLVYSASSCSLLIVDRGNLAIREIQLKDEDCNHEYDGNFHLGIVMLVVAIVSGYLLALLQHRVVAMFSSQKDSMTYRMQGTPYPRAPRSIRLPLIPSEDEPEKHEEGFFSSLGRLLLNTGSSMTEIFSGFGRKPSRFEHKLQHHRQLNKPLNSWPIQESFEISEEDGPPSLETRTPTHKRTYPFMSTDLDGPRHIKNGQSFYGGWDRDYLHRQHYQMHYSSTPKTHYEKSCETNEILFGAVQEQDGRHEAVLIKAIDYGHPRQDQNNLRPRFNYTSYSHA